ncbi:hypothetical protein EDB19DRAFT_1914250 [Suillus lakei]|nr:hypothetical protein EDB19DRAFT_1917757 [Suillus lakei]KAG1727308.1 hypothetical protein EDB19DRAFT_1914250 [Suillus lakei]
MISPTSALGRLPIEVLTHIFGYCLPEYQYLYTASELAPVLLTRICRLWREVAVGTPSLWCRLHVDEDWQGEAYCYDQWLKRSQGRPLSLMLVFPEYHWTELQGLLQPYLNQVWSLHLEHSLIPCQHDITIADFLALEELTVSTEEFPMAIPHFMSQPPPTLRSLNFIGPFFDFKFSAVNPAWSHLTNIDLQVCGPDTLPCLLHLCPDLSSLTVRAASSVDLQASEPFTHAKLQSLRVDCFDSVGPSSLFNAVSLPNLRLLDACYLEGWPHEEFKAFLMRSNCPLESLIFSTGVMAKEEWRAEYLALIPSLKIKVDLVDL